MISPASFLTTIVGFGSSGPSSARSASIALRAAVMAASSPGAITPLGSPILMELDNLGSAESFTITASRLPGGKFSVRSASSKHRRLWPTMCSSSEMRGDLIHALRKRESTDAYSRLEDVGRTSRLADGI
jgi:hypothetical protein